MTEQPQSWRVVSSRQVLHTPFLKIRSDEISLPDGSVLPDYYVIENRGWVGVVPVTSDGLIIVNKQYKHGIGLEVIEFPAGGIDDDEDDPVLAAHRELMEETGYSVAPENMQFLAHMIANPTSAVTRVWWYLARDVRKTGQQKVDPAEVIENVLITPTELLRLIHEGHFLVQGQIAAAYMALEHLGFLHFDL